jgi:hypothetical protein
MNLASLPQYLLDKTFGPMMPNIAILYWIIICCLMILIFFFIGRLSRWIDREVRWILRVANTIKGSLTNHRPTLPKA